MKLTEICKRTSLGENVIAVFGDWFPGPHSLGYLSGIAVDRYYTKIDDVATGVGILELYKIRAGHHYVLGKMETKGNETKFDVVLKITLDPTDIPNLGEFMNVDGVEVTDNQKCYGVATSLYHYLVKVAGFKILGDFQQFFGARRLWARLSKMVDVNVDIIDIKTGTYLEHNVLLHHGTDDWDFDERVWSYGTDKAHIRLILTNI